MSIEEKIADCIKKSGMTIMAISQKTGIPYSALQPSLKGRRELRAGEFAAICGVLSMSPGDFIDDKGA